MAPQSPSPRSGSFLPSFRLRPQWTARNGGPTQTPVNTRAEHGRQEDHDHDAELNVQQEDGDEESDMGDEGLDGEENEEEGEEVEGEEEDEEGAIEEGVFISLQLQGTALHIPQQSPTTWKRGESG